MRKHFLLHDQNTLLEDTVKSLSQKPSQSKAAILNLKRVTYDMKNSVVIYYTKQCYGE